MIQHPIVSFKEFVATATTEFVLLVITTGFINYSDVSLIEFILFHYSILPEIINFPLRSVTASFAISCYFFLSTVGDYKSLIKITTTRIIYLDTTIKSLKIGGYNHITFTVQGSYPSKIFITVIKKFISTFAKVLISLIVLIIVIADKVIRPLSVTIFNTIHLLSVALKEQFHSFHQFPFLTIKIPLSYKFY